MKLQQSFAHSEIFSEALATAVSFSKPDGRLGLLVLRVENLPIVLANYGDTIAEEVMAQLAEEISLLLHGRGEVFRTDKNDISIIFRRMEDPVHTWAKQIHTLVQKFSCIAASVPVYLSASMGSAYFPDNAKETEHLIECAHTALAMVRQGEPFSYHLAYEDTAKRQLHAKHQMILASYMQNAILNKRLRLAFQPVIHSQTGHVMYHESLLRVVDDNGKITSAGPFIPVAESFGFIDVIDDLVLEMVMEELQHSSDIMLAFNISNLTVGNDIWLTKAKQLMKDPDIASRVVVEMTETAMHGDMKKVSNFVATLQGLGCQVAIDDFGAGYTSFRQLKSLPVDIVKIDGYFIKDIVDDLDNRLFVKTLLDFTNGLGLKAVAEFVETGEIAKLLMELKVDYMQGNYFCPAVNYRSWVKEEQ